MRELLLPSRWALEPAVGVLYLLVWFVLVWFVAGGVHDVAGIGAALLLAGAIAGSRVISLAALGLSVLGVSALLIDTAGSVPVSDWLAYSALVLVAFTLAAHGDAVTVWFTLAACLTIAPVSVLVALRADPHSLSSDTSGSSGGVRFPVDTAVEVGQALSVAAGLVLAWLVGLYLARRRSRLGAPESSAVACIVQPVAEPRRVSSLDTPAFVRLLTARQLSFDALLAGVFLALCIPTLHESALAILALGSFTASLAVRRVSPTIALGIAWIAAILQLAGSERAQPEDVAILFVLYATAAYGDRLIRWVGLVSAGVGALIAALYLSSTGGLEDVYYDLISNRIAGLVLQFVFLFVLSLIVLGLSWVLGLLVRTWRIARASRRAQATAELQRHRAQETVVVEQERTRIARDMHDVVAHSLAVVIAQADGARYAATVDPAATEDALRTIAATAREALGDVRVLLAELRDGENEGPQPGVGELDRLIDQMRSAGLAVEFGETGEPLILGPGHQIAMYRIVQEALTNALRHGDTTQPVVVSREWSTQGVRLTIRNRQRDAVPDDTADAGRIGHGLPGMRERAQLAGGWLSAEPHADTFVVTAFLPLVPTGRVRLAS